MGHPGEHKDAVIITNRIGGAVGFGTTSASNFNDHVMGIWMRQDGSQPIHFGFMQRGGDISNIQVTNSGSGYSSSPAITPLSSTVKKEVQQHTLTLIFRQRWELKLIRELKQYVLVNMILKERLTTQYLSGSSRFGNLLSLFKWHNCLFSRIHYGQY